MLPRRAPLGAPTRQSNAARAVHSLRPTTSLEASTMIRLPRLMSSIALASAAFAVTVVIPNPSFAARQAADEKMADDKAAPAATENQGAPTRQRAGTGRTGARGTAAP